MIVNLLEPLAFEVIEANNGQEGLEKITSDRPDAIICDLAMPVMDGWEMLKQLRQSETLRDAIVIVSSASVFEIDRQKSLDAGSNDFLAKPVQADELDLEFLSQDLPKLLVSMHVATERIMDISTSLRTFSPLFPSFPSKRLLSRYTNSTGKISWCGS